MKYVCSIPMVIVLVITILSCNKQKIFDETQIRKSIDKANAQYCEVVKKGDLSGILEIYTDDATIIPPGGAILKGKEAIQAVYEGLLKGGLKEIKMITLEIGGMDDMVYEIGKTKVLIQPEGLEAFSDSSKYMVIWKQQADGLWKVHADIWNFFEPVTNN